MVALDESEMSVLPCLVHKIPRGRGRVAGAASDDCRATGELVRWAYGLLVEKEAQLTDFGDIA
jgi:hypothetical protein